MSEEKVVGTGEEFDADVPEDFLLSCNDFNYFRRLLLAHRKEEDNIAFELNKASLGLSGIPDEDCTRIITKMKQGASVRRKAINHCLKQ
eukprot:TRINITY_DN7814_c0_g1_i3.p1 TRINITY_DN7814_c0_g1~~TRINITY_DN7814_c0_g1_i3.p1  ORF type:complete len:100 (-),score=17.64 TRINITY_DN7814_c0_g1_i3:89-355(-)